ncbi:MAG TPA: Ni-sirohydrochlorin a,c-diamide reductive cyclase ATP-dependent reductase subunit [Methanothermobacter sp.]|nr:nitrogenase iron protein [Methanothermobacter sp. MT-2]HHW05031.1 Ni-sirohydrochlorin a,c-diamide reductive cyclase ATP-dependent reductase subunit [Methanothermobacter sp.]HOK72537.1 Ni-sirohydrochlorin a,c-diamide reductive cyclase ATP-dependent reductase subunit [Methanothermobacter sp.]HOL69400.1 Ni-sirohydrochlorin a,c-diamide reductive cyclase ATP-dependent reductase subunit [Methanothermobacter sp.]HPQ04024.1 Ni-sirohydrochlorin a,c-diamide reductive cyclase ATP-dependent reductase su
MTKKIAIYGKGGIGKSTIVANIAASYSPEYNVLVIGCDPKADTTRTLYGSRIPTILSILRENKKPHPNEVVYKGYKNVSCVESGGPEPGVGCAGRGVIVAMNLLERLGVFEESFDIIIYDVLGDVVCGGFAVPLREEFADEVYIVTSGEYMSLYAANNIAKGIKKLNSKLGGIICNCKGIKNEVKIVESFADRIGSKVIGVIPRSELVPKSEIEAKTVIEKFPDSKQAMVYQELAGKIYENKDFTIPEPLSIDEFEGFFKDLKKKFRGLNL